MRREDIDRAIDTLRAHGVFHAFNMLIFDPDTTLDSILLNLDFMDRYADTPFDFSRAEVYVETPLEKRLLREKKLRGTYFARSYEITDDRAELMFRIASNAFHKRNFADDGLAMLNLAMRLNVEIVRLFYPETWSEELHTRAVGFSRKLGLSSVRYLRAIRDFSASVSTEDLNRIRAYTMDIAQSIHRDDYELFAELRDLGAEIVTRAGGNA